MSSLNFLILGEIRKPLILLKQIFLLKISSLKVNIILVTWNHDLARHPFLKIILKLLKIKIFTLKSPNFSSRVFFQMYTFEKGLEHVNHSLKTLKTRADIFIKIRAIKKISAIDTTTNSPIFHEKVWIPSFDVSKPFYLGDEIIFGNTKDLKKLINYETKYDDMELGVGINHIRRFINPYIEKLQVIENYLIKFKDCFHGSKDRDKKLISLLSNYEFKKYMAFYIFVMKNDFCVGLKGENNYIIWKSWSKGNDQPSNYHSIEEVLQYKSKLTGGQIFLFDEQYKKIPSFCNEDIDIINSYNELKLS